MEISPLMKNLRESLDLRGVPYQTMDSEDDDDGAILHIESTKVENLVIRYAWVRDLDDRKVPISIGYPMYMECEDEDGNITRVDEYDIIGAIDG